MAKEKTEARYKEIHDKFKKRSTEIADGSFKPQEALNKQFTDMSELVDIAKESDVGFVRLRIPGLPPGISIGFDKCGEFKVVSVTRNKDGNKKFELHNVSALSRKLSDAMYIAKMSMMESKVVNRTVDMVESKIDKINQLEKTSYEYLTEVCDKQFKKSDMQFDSLLKESNKTKLAMIVTANNQMKIAEEINSIKNMIQKKTPPESRHNNNISCEEIDSSLSESICRVNRLEMENKELKDRVNQLSSTTFLHELNQDSRDAKALKSQVANLQSELKSMTTASERYKKEIERLKEQYAPIKKDFDAAIARHKQASDAAARTDRDKSAKISELQKELDKKTDDLRGMRLDLKGRETTGKELIAVNTKLTKYENELRDLRTKHAGQAQAIGQLNTENSQLNEKINKLSASVTEKDEQVAQLQLDVSSKERAMKTLEDALNVADKATDAEGRATADQQLALNTKLQIASGRLSLSRDIKVWTEERCEKIMQEATNYISKLSPKYGELLRVKVKEIIAITGEELNAKIAKPRPHVMYEFVESDSDEEPITIMSGPKYTPTVEDITDDEEEVIVAGAEDYDEFASVANRSPAPEAVNETSAVPAVPARAQPATRPTPAVRSKVIKPPPREEGATGSTHPARSGRPADHGSETRDKPSTSAQFAALFDSQPTPPPPPKEEYLNPDAHIKVRKAHSELPSKFTMLLAGNATRRQPNFPPLLPMAQIASIAAHGMTDFIRMRQEWPKNKPLVLFDAVLMFFGHHDCVRARKGIESVKDWPNNFRRAVECADSMTTGDDAMLIFVLPIGEDKKNNSSGISLFRTMCIEESKKIQNKKLHLVELYECMDSKDQMCHKGMIQTEKTPLWSVTGAVVATNACARKLYIFLPKLRGIEMPPLYDTPEYEDKLYGPAFTESTCPIYVNPYVQYDKKTDHIQKKADDPPRHVIEANIRVFKEKQDDFLRIFGLTQKTVVGAYVRKSPPPSSYYERERDWERFQAEGREHYAAQGVKYEGATTSARDRGSVRDRSKDRDPSRDRNGRRETKREEDKDKETRSRVSKRQRLN